MARTRTGVGPVQTAQIIFMVDPKIVGEVEAWRIKRKVNIKSAQYREIFLAGLEAKRAEWTVEHGGVSRHAIKKAAESSVRGTVASARVAAAEVAKREAPAEMPTKPRKGVGSGRKGSRRAAGTVDPS